jgi:release factor glutamine methyltransferase
MRVREALSAAAARLAAVSGTPRLDAELLMAHALAVEREALLLGRLDGEAPAGFDALLARRLAHEPGALVPRPDSETLIEAAVAHFGGQAPARILDLGTGPGTLLLAALDQWPAATGLGIDASAAALGYARRNAVACAEFRLGDWAEGIDERFDLVLCNPPYVEAGAALPPDVAGHEPDAALYAGPDGLDAYRALAQQIPGLLAPGGICCLEIGAGQEERVASLFAARGFTIESRRDLRGIIRCLVLKLAQD